MWIIIIVISKCGLKSESTGHVEFSFYLFYLLFGYR